MSKFAEDVSRCRQTNRIVKNNTTYTGKDAIGLEQHGEFSADGFFCERVTAQQLDRWDTAGAA